MRSQKKGPKLPKYLMNKVEQSETSDPKTVEDFYDLGVGEEESGDRWFTSDLAKSLRFYNRAHDFYKKSLEIDPTFSEALFNLPRLEFDVFNKYVKDDAVIMEDLENCDEVLRSSAVCPLLKNLAEICKTFEQCFDVAQKSNSVLGWDFYYNLALVYFEYTETLCADAATVDSVLNPESEIVLSLQRCISWFDQLLGYMDTYAGKDNDSFSIEFAVQIISDAYNLIATISEQMTSVEKLAALQSITEPLLLKLDAYANEILNHEDLDQAVGDELRIAKLNQMSSSILDFQSLVLCWNSQNNIVGNSMERKLLEGSSYRTFVDKFDGILSDEARWEILTHMSSFYKELSESIREQVTQLERARSSDSDTLSAKIALLCSITIERGDIELERSLLSVEVSIKNKLLLQANAKNILKNAIIFSKKSGGLSESVGGKLSRSKKQREAAMRLCLIEGKTQEEWDVILGPKYWPLELQSLNDINVYKCMIG